MTTDASALSLRNGAAQIPALHELARAFLRLAFSGDTSQWDRAIQMPHYNSRSMPAISLHTGHHCCQARAHARPHSLVLTARLPEGACGSLCRRALLRQCPHQQACMRDQAACPAGGMPACPGAG
jgi:hypothetical protein